MSTKKSEVTSLQSALAGTAAGGIEALVTYPTEYVKTRQQLLRGSKAAESPLGILTTTVSQNGVGSLYTGGTAFCLSNAAKSGIRFICFDTVKSLFPKDVSGKTPVIGTLTAGLAAGVAESFAVLTPGENIKTKMIQDRAGARIFRSTGHAVESILVREGPLGFYRGVWPVAMKQSANAMVRFTSYSFLLEKLKPTLSKYGLPTSVIAGSLAGAITVYCTMPFDSVKTQLQSVEGKQMYTGTWDCVRRLVSGGGVRSLWKGTTPRLVRLSVSGAISFSVYEAVVQWTATMPFIVTQKDAQLPPFSA